MALSTIHTQPHLLPPPLTHHAYTPHKILKGCPLGFRLKYNTKKMKNEDVSRLRSRQHARWVVAGAEEEGWEGGGGMEKRSRIGIQGKNWIPAVASLLYVYWVFGSDIPPGNMLLKSDPNTLKLAFDLSVNFWFILPLTNPDIAPHLNPIMESLFNLVVSWTLMMPAFYSEHRDQRVNMLGFLCMMPFLTNAVYLPYLALRNPYDKNNSRRSEDLTSLERFTDGPWFGRFMSLVGLGCILWGFLGRPEFGDIGYRWDSFLNLYNSDRLAWAFVVDFVCLSLFQSWMVTDDMQRRNFAQKLGDDSAKVALWAARVVPYFGLAYYLSTRPQLDKPENTGSGLSSEE
ncbi:hypothetical protein AAMO2058_000017200 [Amorphochlora amoebiformis]